MNKAEITKQKILEAAIGEFSQKGLYGACINLIAEKSGMNKRLIYEHFGKKEGVFKETTDVDEVVMSINMFTFSYYSIIHTLKHFLHRESENKEAMEKRCDHVTAMILDHILNN